MNFLSIESYINNLYFIIFSNVKIDSSRNNSEIFCSYETNLCQINDKK